jgi:hypothetical protein
MRWWLRAAAGGVVLIISCSTERGPAPLLRVETEAAGADTRLTLVPAASIKLNARVTPALELPDGTVLRFDGADLSADSSYFARPPSALLPGRHRKVRGTLRASVCENDAPVCRSLVLEL